MLNQLAVDAGLGRTGFYVEPVRDGADASHYLTKSQERPAQTAGELTKQRQVPTVLPRNFRRFRASGTAGNGEPTSFYLDEPRPRRTPPSRPWISPSTTRRSRRSATTTGSRASP